MPTVLSIGVFDGVHLGHQALLAAAQRAAQRRGAQVVVLALDPHPGTVLSPKTAPPRIVTAEQKLRLLTRHGADRVELVRPSRELLSQSPAAFVETVVREHEPAAIVEGADFRFGARRQGDVTELRRLGEQMGFEVRVVEKRQVVLCDLMQAAVSSSLVRTLIAQGRVADVARCLGRPWELTACVVEGDKRGRELDMPTANLDLSELADHVRPAPGVYGGTAVLDDGSTHAAAISVGDKPTFAGCDFTIEAHLLGFTGDLYGRRLTLRFERWLRDQLRFASAEQLIEQMQRDLAATRELAALG